MFKSHNRCSKELELRFFFYFIFQISKYRFMFLIQVFSWTRSRSFYLITVIWWYLFIVISYRTSFVLFLLFLSINTKWSVHHWSIETLIYCFFWTCYIIRTWTNGLGSLVFYKMFPSRCFTCLPLLNALSIFPNYIFTNVITTWSKPSLILN